MKSVESMSGFKPALRPQTKSESVWNVLGVSFMISSIAALVIGFGTRISWVLVAAAVLIPAAIFTYRRFLEIRSEVSDKWRKDNQPAITAYLRVQHARALNGLGVQKIQLYGNDERLHDEFVAKFVETTMPRHEAAAGLSGETSGF